MNKFFKDMTTGKDNETHDIARVVMFCNAAALIPVLLLGIGFYLYGYFETKPFDMQSFFTAVLTYTGGVGSLLISGAGAIYFKRSTEPESKPLDTNSSSNNQN